MEQDQGLKPALPFLALDRVDVEIWIGNSVSMEQAANTTDGHQGRSYAALAGQGLRSKKQLKSHVHRSATEAMVSQVTPKSVLTS